jgi:DNA-binding NarL/FixJ family response regulator
MESNYISPPVAASETFRVLIVDDQPAMRGALRYLVSLCLPAAHIVELAEGAQVLERAQTLRPDLVLMDVRLPDANGIELTRHIRSTQPCTKVVVVSINGSKANAMKAREAGAFAFISKERLYADLQPLLVALRDGAGARG